MYAKDSHCNGGCGWGTNGAQLSQHIGTRSQPLRMASTFTIEMLARADSTNDSEQDQRERLVCSTRRKLLEVRRDLVRRDRLTEIKALVLIAIMVFKKLQLFLGLHAFSKHFQT